MALSRGQINKNKDIWRRDKVVISVEDWLKFHKNHEIKETFHVDNPKVDGTVRVFRWCKRCKKGHVEKRWMGVRG